MQFIEMRNGLLAGSAPRSPEIDENDVARKLLQHAWSAVAIDDREGQLARDCPAFARRLIRRRCGFWCWGREFTSPCSAFAPGSFSGDPKVEPVRVRCSGSSRTTAEPSGGTATVEPNRRLAVAVDAAAISYWRPGSRF